jgi:undecaprenyl phosphate-alpha-L-ara4N flippase subunit ArnE
MNGTEIALALAAVLFSTAGQISFKAATARGFSGAILFWGCGASLMFISMLVAAIILRTAPLSALVPFAALAYITVPLASMIVFKESVNKRFWLGTLCIIVGVMLTLT